MHCNLIIILYFTYDTKDQEYIAIIEGEVWVSSIYCFRVDEKFYSKTENLILNFALFCLT